MKPRRTRFETELQVRPGDLDLFRHVRSSRHLEIRLQSEVFAA
jgi:acyl-CoA thioesterase FadM